MSLTDVTPSMSVLFEPLEIRGLRLKNRVVMAPMGTGLDDHGAVTERTIAYYRRRAEGGTGTITIEATLVSPTSTGPELRLHGREFVPGFRALVEAMRPFDCTIGVQLLHPGRQVVEGEVVGPSAVPINSVSPVPHELTVPGIRRIAEQFGEATALALEVGCDFIEVHGAHGYLPSDFLSPVANRREDDYGGSHENRVRFPLEIVAAIRAAGGADLPVFYRVSGEEAIPGGYGIEDTLEVCRLLEAAGVDCISVSSGTWLSLQTTLAPMFIPRGHLVAFAAAVKQAVSLPVIAVGRLDDPLLAARVVAEGSADLIALGRGLTAEPDWARKVEAGRLGDVRPCIACNACVDLVGRGEEARCAVNPEVARELDWKIEPAAKPRRVMVVGAGQAGMEAARIARLRGHEVSLWERDTELGGKLDVASRSPGKEEVLRFRDYQAHQLRELGVEIHLGAEVDAETIARVDPDAVVVSTGAASLVPPIPGIDGPTVVDAQDILLERIPVEPGQRVVIIGGSATGCETAEWLVEPGCGITIVEMLPAVGNGIESITRRYLIKELRRQGVQILTKAKVTAIEPTRVVYELPDGETGEVEADIVALALGWRPRGAALADALEGREVVVAGDASRPGDFVAAINAGANAGLAL